MSEAEGKGKRPRRPRATRPLRHGQLHLDHRGRARMVDVGGKATSARRAVARGRVVLNQAAFAALSEGKLSKGDALAVARLAGILAAKKTSEIVPLAHPIALDAVAVDCVLVPRGREVVVTATVSTTARTGVEMEALTAVTGACLALYDMAKSLDRSITIREVVLLEKTGGRSGPLPALAAVPLSPVGGRGGQDRSRHNVSVAIRVAILTVSDGVSAGTRKDQGGPALEQALRQSGLEHRVVSREVLPDEPKQVARAIRVRADADEADLILLTGGTGVAPRDRTPEGLREAIEFEIPGIAEKMRAETSRALPAAYLSRQVAGVRKKALVVALPGSPKGAADCLTAILALVPHALALVRGERPDHPAPAAPGPTR